MGVHVAPEYAFTDKTQFSKLKAIFDFKDGEVSAAGFEMKSPLIRTADEGGFDTGSARMDYRLDATASSAINRRTGGELFEIKGITMPIRVSGPYAAPDIAFDFAAASGGNVDKQDSRLRGNDVVEFLVVPLNFMGGSIFGMSRNRLLC